MNSNSFAQIDVAQVRVKVSVPIGFEIDVPGTRLTLDLQEADGASRTDAFALALLQTVRETRSGRWFGTGSPVITYTFALSDEGTRRLQAVQRIAITDEPKHFDFNVDVKFSAVPTDAEAVTFWVDLKLGPAEAYMPLVDGAKIEIRHPTKIEIGRSNSRN